MWELTAELSQPVTLPTRGVWMKNSWQHFKWLIDKDPNKYEGVIVLKCV